MQHKRYKPELETIIFCWCFINFGQILKIKLYEIFSTTTSNFTLFIQMTVKTVFCFLGLNSCSHLEQDLL